MGRAFREGIAPESRAATSMQQQKLDLAIGEGQLSKLWHRSNANLGEQGEAVDVPAMLTIEDDKWVWQQVSEEILAGLSHRVVLHDEDSPTTLGSVEDFKMAIAYANYLAQTKGQVVLIEPRN